MYAVNPTVRAAWAELFDWISKSSGVPLVVIDHAAPAPLEDLWRRGDLGLAFICGYPFASGGFPVRPVAAPVPVSELAARRPFYTSHLVVRVERKITTLAQSFGGRIGWTVEHSQSGFNALRSHLLPYRRAGERLYAESIGPLVTPRRVIDAVLAGEIDIGPLDSYFHDLLLTHEPKVAARLRIVETTAPRPMPLLVASAEVEPAIVERLLGTLLAASGDAAVAPVLERLCLSGFAAVEREDYRLLLDDARAAEAAGYLVPG
jgi:ABC-type phosphate/phosphonate transport system substrate-binding protein